MKVRNIVFLVLILTPSYLFAQTPTLPEEIRVTTYYPSPYGSYRQLQSINDNEEVLIGADSTTPGIELRDKDATGNTPYIDFSDDSTVGEDYDMRLILDNGNQLRITGGDLKVDGEIKGTNAKITTAAAATVDPLNVAPYAVIPRYSDSNDSP